MIIQGVWFENVFVASGGMNFFLNGWLYDRYFKKLLPRYSLEGTTKITKIAIAIYINLYNYCDSMNYQY